MSFSDLSIPFLVSNNNENPLQQQQQQQQEQQTNNTTHQQQPVEKANDNDNDDEDAIRFGTNYRFRSFFLGVSVVFLFTLIVSTVTIILNHRLLLLVDDEQLGEERSEEKEQTQYTILLLLEDILAYCGYIIHFLVCVCWLVILSALVISGTSLSELKQASSIRAILFIAGLFYGMTLVTMFFQLCSILPKEQQQHGNDKVLDGPLTTTTAEVGVVGEGVVPSFWFSMLMGILHQGILLAAMYNAFRIKKTTVDAASSEGSSDDKDAAAGNKITNITMKKTEKELRGRTSTRNNKIIYYDNDDIDDDEALMIV